MKKAWTWSEIVIASGNRHKVEELEALLSQRLGIRVVGLQEWEGLPSVEEDRDTFEGNAIKKAEEIAKVLNRPTVADDSGLAVDALKGAPGVYSARYAGLNATDEENNHKLLLSMKDVPEPQRTASFVCAMALAVPEGKSQVVRGECPGRITTSPAGKNGFGYDPLFFIPEQGCTMAELTPSEKNQISHRARAAEKFVTLLEKLYHFSPDNRGE
ncbi:XTP/dITP diphosphatase [Kroppenstedtia pulmonis]|uniref:dITP/XTP pyrophosphatase n=1 Tax=Kroppenstedtia pulmonis TaxID=1380685 RepID=A0A7D3XIL0_9BACL|nr:XTP/dITP diphosphatase [Kroppenstedtia pulmonis]QKG84059.1 XTP/dITP diphosphatase [Kroppenstedtia pulmonis]